MAATVTRTGTISTAGVRHAVLYIFVFLLGYENWQALAVGGGITIPRLVGLLYAALAVLNINTMYSLNGVNIKPVTILMVLWGWVVSVSAVIYLTHEFQPIFHSTLFQLIFLFLLITNEIRLYPRVRVNILLALIIGVFSVFVLVVNDIGVKTGVESGEVKSLETVTRLWFMGMNPNQFGTLVVFALLSTISLVFSGNIITKARYGLLTLVPSQILLIGYSGSAGAYLLAFSGVFIYFLLSRGQPTKKIIYMVLCAFFFVYMYTTLSGFGYLSNKMITFYQTGDTTGRTALWSFALQIAAEHPFIGLGHVGARSILEEISKINASPQNVFVGYLITGGPLALMLFLSFCWVLFRRSWVYLKATGDPSSIMFLAVILMYFLKAGGQGDKYVWLLFSWIASASILHRGPVSRPIFAANKTAYKPRESLFRAANGSDS